MHLLRCFVKVELALESVQFAQRFLGEPDIAQTSFFHYPLRRNRVLNSIKRGKIGLYVENRRSIHDIRIYSSLSRPFLLTRND